MKKIIFLFSFFILLTSCKPTQNAAVGSSMEELWSKPPDLSKVVYTGGDGTSIENAIVISGAGNERNGIAAEYEYITKKKGVKFVDWKPAGQSTINKDSKKYDAVSIQNIKNNETITFYFDISDFYGKW